MSEHSEFWLSHLSAIEAAGITTKAYAERDRLSAQALCQWRKRLVAGARASRAKLGGFVPIQIESSMAVRAGCTVVIDTQAGARASALIYSLWVKIVVASIESET